MTRDQKKKCELPQWSKHNKREVKRKVTTRHWHCWYESFSCVFFIAARWKKNWFEFVYPSDRFNWIQVAVQDIMAYEHHVFLFNYFTSVAFSATKEWLYNLDQRDQWENALYKSLERNQVSTSTSDKCKLILIISSRMRVCSPVCICFWAARNESGKVKEPFIVVYVIHLFLSALCRLSSFQCTTWNRYICIYLKK